MFDAHKLHMAQNGLRKEINTSIADAASFHPRYWISMTCAEQGEFSRDLYHRAAETACLRDPFSPRVL